VFHPAITAIDFFSEKTTSIERKFKGFELNRSTRAREDV